MKKYRKVLFNTNDKTYPTLILRNDGIYTLVDKDGHLTGDGFDGKEDVLKHFPNADLYDVSIPSGDWDDEG